MRKRFESTGKVWVRNYNGEKKWIPGIVVKKTRPVSYQVKVEHDRVWKRHADQLRHRVKEKKVSQIDTKNKEEKSPEKTVPEIISEPDRPRVALEHDCQETDRPIITAEHKPNRRSS